VRGDEDAARAHLDQVDDGELPTDDRAEAEWLRSRL
jgi:hypothetical protein